LDLLSKFNSSIVVTFRFRELSHPQSVLLSSSLFSVSLQLVVSFEDVNDEVGQRGLRERIVLLRFVQRLNLDE